MDFDTYKLLLLDENVSDVTIFNAVLEFLDDSMPLVPEVENGEVLELARQHRPEVSIRVHARALELCLHSDTGKMDLIKEYQLANDASYLDIARAMYKKGED